MSAKQLIYKTDSPGIKHNSNITYMPILICKEVIINMGKKPLNVLYQKCVRQFSKDHRNKIGKAKREWKTNNQNVKYN